MTEKTDFHDPTMLKTSDTQSAMLNNRFIIGIVAFGVSFGLSLVLNWNVNQAFFTGIITVPATYLAALFVDKRRRNHEMLILDSLHKRIKELEGLKSRIVTEINQLQAHNDVLYTESNQLQNQVTERRNQRDNLNRELGNFAIEKKQLEAEITHLQDAIQSLDQGKVELSHAFSTLNTEKRRLELHSNALRAEINQLQTQISELQQEKQEVESNLTLLNRLKPQLEEKLYQLRVRIQELEVQENQYKQTLTEKKVEKENLETSLSSLSNNLTEQQTQLQHLQEQISLLQQERDELQNQVWDLLHQMETLPINQQENHIEILNQKYLLNDEQSEDDFEYFPFADLIESLDTPNDQVEKLENFSREWMEFLENLPDPEIQVLRAIVEQENPNTIIKHIAEENITMPNLLIDSINERASDTIGELLINPSRETPEIYQEHLINVKQLIVVYEDIRLKQASSN